MYQILKSSKIGIVSNFQRLSNSADFSKNVNKMKTNNLLLEICKGWKFENLKKEVKLHYLCIIGEKQILKLKQKQKCHGSSHPDKHTFLCRNY